MTTVSVRYIVNDVDAAIDFYCRLLGFHEVMHPAPALAMLSRGDLRLVLSAPGGGPGGGQAMADGTVPEPGGWNRFQLEVADDRGRAVGKDRRQGTGQKVEDTKTTVAEKKDELLGKAKQASPQSAATAASRASEQARQNPLPVAAAGAFALGFLAGRVTKR